MDNTGLYLYYFGMEEQKLFIGETVESKRILYTPSLFAKENLFYLQETGSLQARKPHVNKRSYLDSYLFFIVQSGAGTVEQDNRSYFLRAGDCVLIDCHKPYAQYSSEDLWSLSWAHFNSTSMPGVYSKYLERSHSLRFHTEQLSLYSDLINTLFRAASSDSFVRDMEINELLSSLLTNCMRDCWNNEEVSPLAVNHRNIEPIRQYMLEHWNEKITLEELAGQFYINRFYLSKLFHETYHMTISDYLLELRINRAKEYLRFSDASLNEIADQCGFYDLAYFSRKFKKAEGISPSAYRRQWINQQR